MSTFPAVHASTSRLVQPSGVGADGSAARRAAIYAAGVLFFTNLVSYLDRTALTLLVQPVKASLALTDGQIGLVTGAAFVVTYTLAGLFMGRLVDRTDRRRLLMICILVWSVSTAATGLSRNFWEMFVSRMGVGLGEAVLYPTAVSLIADHFSPAQRGRPYGIFTMGVYAGTGLSLVGVGLILARLTALSTWLGEHHLVVEPWRLAMMSMVIPGLVCIAAVAAMREPARTKSDSSSPLDVSGLREWARRAAVFVPHHLSLALVTLATYGLNAWMPTVLIREYGRSAKETGLLYGLVVAGVGITCSFIGGFIIDMAARRAGALGRMYVTVVCLALATAGFIFLSFVHQVPLILLGVVLVISPSSISLIAGIMAMSDLSPGHARGQITAVYFVFAGVIGVGGGPAVVGYANDLFGHPGFTLGAIVPLVGVLATGLAVPLALLATLGVKRLAERAPA